MKNASPIRFAICLKNKGSEDLVIRKVYQVVPDKRAEEQGLRHIIDESGADSLYPAGYFSFVDLPQREGPRRPFTDMPGVVVGSHTGPSGGTRYLRMILR